MPLKSNRPASKAHAAKQSKNARTLLTFLFGQADGFSIFQIAAVLILLGWTADTGLELYIYLREMVWQQSPVLGVYVAAAPILIFFLWLLNFRLLAKRRLEKSILRGRSKPVRPRKTLVVILSVTRNPDDAPEVLGAEQSNWRMPIEAIKAHLRKGHLKELWLVGSNGLPSSQMQIPAFEALLDNMIPDIQHVVVRTLADLPDNTYPSGVDFNDPEAVVDALEQIRLHHEASMARDELIIDITGGRTTTSAAASTVCQHLGVAFQYVDARESPEGGKVFEVNEYALELVPADNN